MDMYKAWLSLLGSRYPDMNYTRKVASLDRLEYVIEASSRTEAGADLPGFMHRRNDYDVEYDDSAELIVADLELNEEDTPDERGVKLACMKNLTERLRRREGVKSFVNRFQLNKIQNQMDLCRARTSEELDVAGRTRPIQRLFGSQHEYQSFIQNVLYERRLESRLAQLAINSPNKTTLPHAKNVKSSNDVVEIKIEPDDSKPVTRSRSMVDSSRRIKVTEQEMKRVLEQTQLESTVSSHNGTVVEDEIGMMGSAGTDINKYAYIKGTVLRYLETSRLNNAKVSMRSFGNVTRIEVEGFFTDGQSLQLDS
jgi:transcriptional adapter 2-alpha